MQFHTFETIYSSLLLPMSIFSCRQQVVSL